MVSPFNGSAHVIPSEARQQNGFIGEVRTAFLPTTLGEFVFTRTLMIIVLLIVAVLTAMSQDSTRNTGHVIRGTVLDAVSNTPITGATVTVTEN
ncbi:MAG: hypothetical protein H7X70_01750, partial [Candidatus Kapabacteria bacterium]|nr:hypothetical protein [Candidatus Kapabacteria bacterium]